VIVPNVPIEATFKETAKAVDGIETTWFNTRPVVAFNDDDEPLVIADSRKCLVRAARYTNFAGIRVARGRVVAALPAGDWKVLWKGDGNKPTPLVGWVVYENGDCVGLDADYEGVVTELEPASDQSWEIIPAGGWGEEVSE